MLVMLAYDLPNVKHQTLLRKEFEALGGYRVQYSLYLFDGEPHECERVIRYMRRVVEVYVPEGDVRLIPMENRVWEQQIILLGLDAEPKERPFAAFVLIW